MSDKITIDLTGVPKTLLLPLLGRAIFSQKSYSPIHDTRAVELINAIDYDFSDLLKQVGAYSLFWMARAYQFDEAAKIYLKNHPKAVVVNLGAGLETAFHRIDNGQLTWVDLDLPEVIELRKKLLPPTEREHYIAKSILDNTWIDEIKPYGNEVFFIAGGFFMYFTEDQVKSIFSNMATHFPKAELAFDTISRSGLKYANKMLMHAGIENALLQWGLDNSMCLEQWSPQIKVIKHSRYFHNIKRRSGFPWSMRFKMALYDFFNKGEIVQLKFLS